MRPSLQANTNMMGALRPSLLSSSLGESIPFQRRAVCLLAKDHLAFLPQPTMRFAPSALVPADAPTSQVDRRRPLDAASPSVGGLPQQAAYSQRWPTSHSSRPGAAPSRRPIHPGARAL